MKISRVKAIAKLGNAIREFRGLYSPKSGKWIHPPNPKRAEGVLRWLKELGFDEPIIGLADIQEFKTFAEMREWMRKL